MPTSQEQEEALFRAAVELPADKRPAFLDAMCAGDSALRARLTALIAERDQSNSLPTTPVATIKLDLPPLQDEAIGGMIGPYKLLEKVGEGGFGVVYVAEQREPVKRRVALKIIKLGMDTRQVVARFEAERQALALMDHPNIAKVFDAGATETGRPYFVMELVRGISITQYCDQNNLPTNDRLNLFVQVCQAIQHAHQKGIIHRDIKPSNILITLLDGVAIPKVIDFGIAKATSGQQLTDKTLYTAIEQFIGTPAYMSPEQANLSGLDVDTRTDIYSLGVLLYELLTGSTPFDAHELFNSGLDAIRRTIREVEPPRPSTRLGALQREDLMVTAKQHGTESVHLLKRIRGDLDWIVMKCIEKDRARRYETANGLGADVKRHLNNEPVVARPPSALYKLRKAIRRNKLAFGAGAAVGLALVVGLTLATLGLQRARVERDNARNAQMREENQTEAARDSAAKAQVEKDRARWLSYVADMRLAQQFWKQNNIPLVRELLDETQDFTNRDFEWYYWQGRTHFEVKTIGSRLGKVNSVAFSPDGQRIIMGNDDSTANVWDADTGKELFTLKGHTSGLSSAAFSPDGQRIVTGSGDHTAKVWDAATGKELFTLTGHSNWVLSVSFSPNGQRIVTGSGDQTAKVWDANTGMELLTLRNHVGEVNSVAFSPDGQRIVTGSWDGTARVWDAANGQQLLRLRGHRGFVNSVAFSPNGRLIVTGSADMTAKVWDADVGTELLTLKGHTSNILSVAFSPDGQRIVTGSADSMAKVWATSSVLNTVNGRELLTLEGHTDRVTSVAFSPDGRRIVTGGDDSTAKIWRAANEVQVAAWQEEERKADETVTHAGDEGAIKQWLILAPIPLPLGLRGAKGLEIEQIADERRLMPKLGDICSVGAANLQWTNILLASYAMDFNDILGKVNENSAAYAVTYIESETDQTGLVMIVGSDDEAKIYLNQQEIYRNLNPVKFERDRDRVAGVELKAGLNTLVFKVVNETRDWTGSIRFTDAWGNPLHRIKVTLNSEAKSPL